MKSQVPKAWPSGQWMPQEFEQRESARLDNMGGTRHQRGHSKEGQLRGAIRRAGGMRTKTLLGSEQGCRCSGDGLEGRVQDGKSQSGENAFTQHTWLSDHKMPSTEEGCQQKKNWEIKLMIR